MALAGVTLTRRRTARGTAKVSSAAAFGLVSFQVRGGVHRSALGRQLAQDVEHGG